MQEAEWGLLKKAYDLKNDNFRPDPEVNYQICFGRADALSKFGDILSAATSAKEWAKVAIAGTWGFGKTHTSLHIAYRYRDYLNWIYVKLPDFYGDESFVEDFYARLMSQVFRSYFKVEEKRLSLKELLRRAMEKGMMDKFRKYGPCYETLIDYTIAPPDRESEILETIKNADLDTAITYLEMTGKVIAEMTEKPLYFIIDEAHRLKNFKRDAREVGGRRAFREWSTDLKVIIETKFPIGLVFTAGITEVTEVELFKELEISGRGLSRLELKPFDEKVIPEFLKSIIKWARDGWDEKEKDFNKPEDKTIKKINKFNEKYPEEKTSIDYYPLTEKAFNKFIENTTGLSDEFRAPRYICHILNNIAGYSQCLKREIILENDVEELFEGIKSRLGIK